MEVVAFVGFSINSTNNGQEDHQIYYQQAPTMFFVVAGLASMLFLVIIAIILLCYSHSINRSERQFETRSQNTSSTNLYFENGFRGSNSQLSSPETPHQTTPIFFVCNPGQSKPTYFAQVASLVPNHIVLPENMNYINRNLLYFQTSGFQTPISMPSSPLLLQPQVGFEHELIERDSTRHSSTLQSLETNTNISSHIPLSSSSNNETLLNIMVDYNELNMHDVHKTISIEVISKNLQAQVNASQSVDEQFHAPSINVINNTPTLKLENSEFIREKLNGANKRIQIFNKNVLPSTSYSDSPQKELQQIEGSLPNFVVESIKVLKPINDVIQRDSTSLTNIESIQKMNSIDHNSIPNKPCILSIPSTSNSPQFIPMLTSKPNIEGQTNQIQEIKDVEVSHDNNSILLLEPSVNIVTHSIQ